MKLMIALGTSAQQQTAAFKKWFGKSKVVDKEGNPLRVYHGTTQNFDVFDKIHIGKGNNENGVGFYFTDNAAWTRGYASGEGGNTLAVYLKIQKPIYYERQPEATYTQIVKLTQRAGASVLKEFIRDNYDVDHQGLEAARREYRDLYVGMSLVEASFSIYTELYEGSKREAMFAEIFKDVTGYDGIIVKQPQGTNYVVFTPTQIKSAVGNKGTFKPRTPGIYE